MKPVPAPLRLLPNVAPVDGIDSFSLAGMVDDQVVVASWDGSLPAVSELLYERASLTVAFEPGFGPGGWRFALDGAVTDVVLTLAWSCDVVDVVEFRRWGARRAVIAVPSWSATAVDIGVATGP